MSSSTRVPSAEITGLSGALMKRVRQEDGG